MLFTSCVFLFIFLPVVVGVYYLLLKIPFLRNLWLTLASLFFYSWGEVEYCWVMFAIIVLNFLAAIVIEKQKGVRAQTVTLWCTGALNLLVLGVFKYAGFFADNANAILAGMKMPMLNIGPIHLPLGISFFIFHSLSYVIDVYRGTASAQKNPFNMALYISLFPQLIAGPIVRYHDICDQLTARQHKLDNFAGGLRRFVLGLAKKVLIANALAVPADKIFSLPQNELSAGVAWFGAICYTFQIYFDFSGYSDMAVGLAALFGFKLPENFNYPYIAKSMREFWQRWHMSLSNWFRDYLYVPLGGNRVSAARVCLNLGIVFLLCGIWHGASWQFVAWGLMHGSFLGAERAFLGKLLTRLWLPFQHLYVAVTVVFSWVLFRASSFPQAVAFWKAMIGLGNERTMYPLETVISAELLFIVFLAIIASMPISKLITRVGEIRLSNNIGFARTAWAGGIFALCLAELAAGTYNPFIYFRF
jgi:alginate O-acetyltransferase complex protein AlgI